MLQPDETEEAAKATPDRRPWNVRPASQARNCLVDEIELGVQTLNTIVQGSEIPAQAFNFS
jgi:hypothetical protein